MQNTSEKKTIRELEEILYTGSPLHSLIYLNDEAIARTMTNPGPFGIAYKSVNFKNKDFLLYNNRDKLTYAVAMSLYYYLDDFLKQFIANSVVEEGSSVADVEALIHDIINYDTPWKDVRHEFLEYVEQVFNQAYMKLPRWQTHPKQWTPFGKTLGVPFDFSASTSSDLHEQVFIERLRSNLGELIRPANVSVETSDSGMKVTFFGIDPKMMPQIKTDISLFTIKDCLMMAFDPSIIIVGGNTFNHKNLPILLRTSNAVEGIARMDDPHEIYSAEDLVDIENEEDLYVHPIEVDVEGIENLFGVETTPSGASTYTLKTWDTQWFHPIFEQVQMELLNYSRFTRLLSDIMSIYPAVRVDLVFKGIPGSTKDSESFNLDVTVDDLNDFESYFVWHHDGCYDLDPDDADHQNVATSIEIMESFIKDIVEFLQKFESPKVEKKEAVEEPKKLQVNDSF
jgi:hypothetical protein